MPPVLQMVKQKLKAPVIWRPMPLQAMMFPARTPIRRWTIQKAIMPTRYRDIITQIEESEAAALAQGESSETSSDGQEAGESSSDEGDVAVNANAQAAYDGSVKIAWPVAGNILIDFSMDTTTYFQTLDQYKCNPGILIGAEVNTPVTCAYGGVVESIYGDDEYGTCIVVNMGNDYRAIYGQVKDVAVSEGQAVTAGQQLAFVAQPSRYYTLEGSHLFFEITKDDISVNPHNYLN